MATTLAASIWQPVVEVEFRLDGSKVPAANAVSLVGSFNRWERNVHRMTHQADGFWSISVVLSPGKYQYLFVVDGFPYNDPNDDERTPCEWGGSYSVRIVR